MYQGPHSALAMIEVGQLWVALKLVHLYHGAMSDVLDTAASRLIMPLTPPSHKAGGRMRALLRPLSLWVRR
jgi:hypothetical protein